MIKIRYWRQIKSINILVENGYDVWFELPLIVVLKRTKRS